jgi:Rhodopirellula transposase DDE domain
MNWRGTPLTDIRTIAELIAAATTKIGLTVQCAYDPNWYPTAVKITNRDYDTIPLTPHNWHGEWTYTIAQSNAR